MGIRVHQSTVGIVFEWATFFQTFHVIAFEVKVEDGRARIRLGNDTVVFLFDSVKVMTVVP